MNAKDKPHAPKTPKIRAILADTTLTTSARLAAVELYCHTDWMTGELVCRHTIAAHIRRTIGVKRSASTVIVSQLRERGYIKGGFFIPTPEPTGPVNRPAGKMARPVDRPPPAGKPATPPAGRPDTPGRQTGHPPAGRPATPGRRTGHISSSPSYSLPSPSSDPRRPDTREESREERERRYAEAQRRQAEEHRRREGERFGLPDGFLEKYYVKGDGR